MLGKIFNLESSARFNLGFAEAKDHWKCIEMFISGNEVGGMGNQYCMTIEISVHDILESFGAEYTTKSAKIWQDKNFLKGYTNHLKALLTEKGNGSLVLGRDYGKKHSSDIVREPHWIFIRMYVETIDYRAAANRIIASI